MFKRCSQPVICGKEREFNGFIWKCQSPEDRTIRLNKSLNSWLWTCPDSIVTVSLHLILLSVLKHFLCLLSRNSLWCKSIACHVRPTEDQRSLQLCCAFTFLSPLVFWLYRHKSAPAPYILHYIVCLSFLWFCLKIMLNSYVNITLVLNG